MSANWYDTGSESGQSKKPMNFDFKYVIIVLVLILAVILASLSFGTIKSAFNSAFGTVKYKTESICEIVVDRTGSASSTNVTSHFQKLAKSSSEACAEKHALVDIWTTGSDGVNPTLVKSSVRLIYAGAKLSYYINKELFAQHQIQSALSKVFQNSSSGSSKGSDIVSALSQAASTGTKEAASNGGVPVNLILITDGMQLTQGVAVTSMSSIDSDPNLLARQAQNLYPMAGLRGTNVFFYGVRGGTLSSTGQALPAWFENKVNAFWSDLVTSNGGFVCSYQNDQSISAFLICGGK